MGEVSLILLFMIVRAETVRTRVLLASRSRRSRSRSSARGSRGPVIGMVVALPSVLLWRAASPAVAKRLALAIVAVGALAVVAVVAFVPPEATQRSLSIFQTTHEAGDTSRFVLWGEATHAFSREPDAHARRHRHGRLRGHLDNGALYPHNIVLEVASELGVLGRARRWPRSCSR